MVTAVEENIKSAISLDFNLGQLKKNTERLFISIAHVIAVCKVYIGCHKNTLVLYCIANIAGVLCFQFSRSFHKNSFIIVQQNKHSTMKMI